jgi:HD-GYP domain-containing protein (c-di-GMP phosphodiesterase class II)
LADAFDAMTSDRPYRKAFSTEKALKIIQSQRGKQFHPELVDIFLGFQGKLHE